MAKSSGKIRIVYACSECGSSYPKWSGQCGSCGDWNTLSEEIEGPGDALKAPPPPTNRPGPVLIGNVGTEAGQPRPTQIDELDRVLGGGIVPGAVMLLGGEPGIGKSTLLLQLLASWDGPTLYVSAEESAQQVRLRAERLDAVRPQLWLHAETSLPHILESIEETKPELVVIADISGSVAAFARFTLMLVYAIQNQFSKVRSFVFIDGIDEVTDYFKATDDIQEAIHRVNTEADVVWVDGHSDYGHAFEVWWNKYGKDVGPKSTVLLLGDARNNYHASQSWVVKEIQQKARHVYWLNPEPKSYWNTGDSIVGEYGTYTDGVYECRNLRQLESFVDLLA